MIEFIVGTQTPETPEPVKFSQTIPGEIYHCDIGSLGCKVLILQNSNEEKFGLYLENRSDGSHPGSQIIKNVNNFMYTPTNHTAILGYR